MARPNVAGALRSGIHAIENPYRNYKGKGYFEARSIEQRGQIWGNALQQVSQTIGSAISSLPAAEAQAEIQKVQIEQAKINLGKSKQELAQNDADAMAVFSYLKSSGQLPESMTQETYKANYDQYVNSIADRLTGAEKGLTKQQIRQNSRAQRRGQEVPHIIPQADTPDYNSKDFDFKRIKTIIGEHEIYRGNIQTEITKLMEDVNTAGGTLDPLLNEGAYIVSESIKQGVQPMPGDNGKTGHMTFSAMVPTYDNLGNVILDDQNQPVLEEKSTTINSNLFDGKGSWRHQIKASVDLDTWGINAEKNNPLYKQFRQGTGNYSGLIAMEKGDASYNELVADYNARAYTTDEKTGKKVTTPWLKSMQRSLRAQYPDADLQFIDSNENGRVDGNEFMDTVLPVMNGARLTRSEYEALQARKTRSTSGQDEPVDLGAIIRDTDIDVASAARPNNADEKQNSKNYFAPDRYGFKNDDIVEVENGVVTFTRPAQVDSFNLQTRPEQILASFDTNSIQGRKELTRRKLENQYTKAGKIPAQMIEQILDETYDDLIKQVNSAKNATSAKEVLNIFRVANSNELPYEAQVIYFTLD